MKQFTLLIFMLLLISISTKAISDKIAKDSITFGGKQRTYYLFVPETVNKPVA